MKRWPFYSNLALFVLSAASLWWTATFHLDELRYTKSLESFQWNVRNFDGITICPLGAPKDHPKLAMRYSPQSHQEYVVLASHTLSAQEALELREQFKFVHAYGKGAMCHYPAYLIKLHHKGLKLMEFTLCFQCFNVEFNQFPLGGASLGISTNEQVNMEALAQMVAKSSKHSSR